MYTHVGNNFCVDNFACFQMLLLFRYYGTIHFFFFFTFLLPFFHKFCDLLVNVCVFLLIDVNFSNFVSFFFFKILRFFQILFHCFNILSILTVDWCKKSNTFSLLYKTLKDFASTLLYKTLLQLYLASTTIISN